MLLLAAIFVCAVRTARAQDAPPEDAEGCKDSSLVARFPGSHINSCDNKEFDAADVPINSNGDQKHLEGEYHYWDYGTRDGLSQLQIFRNFQNALKTAGFTIDYAGSPDDLTAHKGATWIYISSRGSYYYQTIVNVKAMEQEATADASALQSEIEKSGHVAVYGIHFDTGKATITADSDDMLNQIVQLLQKNSDLKLRVEGHTDNQGAGPANQTLSEKRAQAVVDWLVAHGVEAGRLKAAGFGATKPVADNSTEDGRAKNRRVELAKQ
jgi:OOP family OmpA-OmpF porin